MKNSPQHSEVLPWNSTRVANDSSTHFVSIESRRKSRQVKEKNIFSLSYRVSGERKAKEEKIEKPKTAPIKNRSAAISEEFKNLGTVKRSELVSSGFEEKIETMNNYPFFKTSFKNRKQLLYLKPQIDSQKKRHKKTTSMDKIKTQIYKSLRDSIQYPEQTQPTTVIQYLTEYEPDEIQKLKKGSHSLRRKVPLSVLRQKLKNRCKETAYSRRIALVKQGRGMPITVIK